MNICPNCNSPVGENEKFCSNCGTPLEAKKSAPVLKCSKCGAENSAESIFCEECGTKLGENKDNTEQKQEQTADTVQKAAPAAPAYATPAAAAQSAPVKSAAAPKKSAPDKKKLIPIIIAAVAAMGAFFIVAAIVLTIIIVSIVSGGGSGTDAIYLKDDELYRPDYNASEGWQVTSDYDGNGSYSSQDLISKTSDAIYDKIWISKDKKLIFFPDKMTGESYYNIYYRYLNGNDEEHKMDTDVISYVISDDGKTVVYLKDNNLSLYRYSVDKDEKEKLCSGVKNYSVSIDFKKVAILDDNENFFCFDMYGEKDKIDRGVQEVYFADEHLDTMYYTKGGTLYKKQPGQEKEKISDGVSAILCVCDNGDIYYKKDDSVDSDSVTYYDMIEDDLRDHDENWTMPERPERVYRSSYSSDEEYRKANDAYLKKYAEYEEGAAEQENIYKRKNLREQLKNEHCYDYLSELYYYNGTENCLSKNVSGYVRCSGVAPVVVFAEGEVQKLKFSELCKSDMSSYEIGSLINENLSKSKNVCIASGETVKKLDFSSLSSVVFTEDSNILYLLMSKDKDTEDDIADIYKISISGGNIGDPELCYEDVCSSYAMCKDGRLYYFRDVIDRDSRSTGSLYVDQNKVDDDVSIRFYSVENGRFVYYKDTDDYGFTAYYYNGSSCEKIHDDVYRITTLSDGTVMYLADYNTSLYQGDLYIFRNGGSDKIDDDVMYFDELSERYVRRYLSA